MPATANPVSISVLTATYNAGDQLPRLIESLRQQSDRDFEWIVIDGASSDGTTAILQSAADVVTRWASEPDFGIYDALNKGLALSQGTYYLVVGADDSLATDAIARYGRAANETSADVITASVIVNGEVKTPRRRFGWLRSGPPMVSAHSVGCIIKSSLHDEIGPYSRRFPIAADTFFLLQAMSRGKTFHFLDGFVAGTFGNQGISSSDRLGSLAESFRANVEVRGMLPLQLPLFALRVLRHARAIMRRPRGSRP